MRLIKDYRDARGELLLSAGGTDFCQGLTIVVNDKHGMLPLNPTKQGKRSCCLLYVRTVYFMVICDL